MEKLVKKAKKGDGDAFFMLLKQYEDILYRTAKRIVNDEQDIADVMQDTFLTAFEKIHTLKKNKYFHTWLFRILLNKCASLTKTKQTHSAIELDNYLNELDKGYSTIEFKDAVNSLKEERRVILTLYYAVGYTIKEISHIVSQSEGTVKSHLSRGRNELRTQYYSTKIGVDENESITSSCP